MLQSIPAGTWRESTNPCPFWRPGVLVEAPHSTEELTPAHRERGFALVGTRCPRRKGPIGSATGREPVTFSWANP